MEFTDDAFDRGQLKDVITSSKFSYISKMRGISRARSGLQAVTSHLLLADNAMAQNASKNIHRQAVGRMNMPNNAENEHPKFVVNTAVEEVQCTLSVASSIRGCVPTGAVMMLPQDFAIQYERPLLLDGDPYSKVRC